MEEILQNIAKINTAAVEIMDAAAKQKAAQDTEMAARTKAFDEQMEADTAEKIAALQSSLQQKLEDNLSQLRAQTDAELAALNSNYEKNHRTMAQALVDAMTKE